MARGLQFLVRQTRALKDDAKKDSPCRSFRPKPLCRRSGLISRALHRTRAARINRRNLRTCSTARRAIPAPITNWPPRSQLRLPRPQRRMPRSRHRRRPPRRRPPRPQRRLPRPRRLFLTASLRLRLPPSQIRRRPGTWRHRQISRRWARRKPAPLPQSPGRQRHPGPRRTLQKSHPPQQRPPLLQPRPLLQRRPPHPPVRTHPAPTHLPSLRRPLLRSAQTLFPLTIPAPARPAKVPPDAELARTPQAPIQLRGFNPPPPRAPQPIHRQSRQSPLAAKPP